MLVRMVTLLQLLIGVHLAACNTILYDNCIVNEETVELSTFRDSVEFLISAKPGKDLVVTVEEGSKKGRFQRTIRDLNWMKCELKLKGRPQLTTGRDTFATENITFSEGTRKRVKIENAYVLKRCHQDQPNWELRNDDNKPFIRIPSSGEGEDFLILLPKDDTKVAMNVGGEKRVLCRERDTVRLVREEEREGCRNLKKDQEVRLKLTRHDTQQIIEILGHPTTSISVEGESKELNILRERLTGALYIVQCLRSCTSEGTEASVTEGTFETGTEASTTGGTIETIIGAPATAGILDTGGEWILWTGIGVIGFLFILIILLTVMAIRTRSQLQHERNRLQALRKSQNASATTGGGQNNQVYQGQTNQNGVVDTTNDIYVPFDELWQE